MRHGPSGEKEKGAFRGGGGKPEVLPHLKRGGNVSRPKKKGQSAGDYEKEKKEGGGPYPMPVGRGGGETT